VRGACVMLVLLVREAFDVIVAFALAGLAAPVVLLRRSADPGRLIGAFAGKFAAAAAEAALSLRLLSTSSILGRCLTFRLTDRTIGYTGEL
jgi:hypothetical protein